MTQPIVPPQQYYPQVDKTVDPKVTLHLQRIYQWNNNQEAAILALNTKFEDSIKTASSATGNTTTNITENVSAAGVTSFNSLSGAVTYFPSLGVINNQTGNTSYTTQSSDAGVVMLFDDASAIALSLSSSTVGQPFFFFAVNLGAGTVTMTPTTGTVNGGATFAVAQDALSIVAFDGTNWTASALPAGGSGPTNDYTKVFELMGG